MASPPLFLASSPLFWVFRLFILIVNGRGFAASFFLLLRLFFLASTTVWFVAKFYLVYFTIYYGVLNLKEKRVS